MLSTDSPHWCKRVIVPLCRYMIYGPTLPGQEDEGWVVPNWKCSPRGTHFESFVGIFSKPRLHFCPLCRVLLIRDSLSVFLSVAVRALSVGAEHARTPQHCAAHWWCEREISDLVMIGLSGCLSIWSFPPCGKISFVSHPTHQVF